MLIIFDKPGQLCNRLWSYAPFISYSMCNKVNLRILFFQEYKGLFDNSLSFKNIRFSKNNKLINLIIKLFVNNLQYLPKGLLSFFNFKLIESIDFSNGLLRYDPSLKNKIYFLSSWLAPKPPITSVNRKQIINFFRPNKQDREIVDQWLIPLKKKYTSIVGIHIRRGDYKEYYGGKFYYTDVTYKNIMKQIFKQSSGKVCFVICSNDQINYEVFSGLTTVQHGKSAIQDLYILSQCDYIVGPPSSFSMWASFYGQVKIKFIVDPDEKINIKDFSPIVQQNMLANGKPWI